MMDNIDMNIFQVEDQHHVKYTQQHVARIPSYITAYFARVQ